MSRTMNEITVEAVVDNLEQVMAFVDGRLEELGCPDDTQFQVEVAAEELFTNIANYAYAPATGSVTIRAEAETEPPSVSFTFVDSGIPYDPLAKEDPDLTLSLEDRPIGGLGIFMTKQSMDEMAYRRENGRNMTTIRKRW